MIAGPESLPKSSRPWLLGGIAVALAFLAAFLLRVALLGDREVFRDEAASWILTRLSPLDLVERTAHEAYPPLYGVLLGVWVAVFGDGLASMRFLSVLAGMATLFAGYRWTLEAAGRRAAFVALLVMATSPLALAEARLVRMYVFESCSATFAWWLAWRLATGRSGHPRLEVVALAIAVAAELWVSAYGIPLAGLQVVAVIAAAWRRVDRPRRALAGLAVGIGSFMPWLPLLLTSTVGQSSFWTPRPAAVEILNTYSSWLSEGHEYSIEIGLAGCAAALLGLLLALRSEDAGRRCFGLFCLACLALVPGIWIASQIHPAYDVRYFGPILPALAGGLGIAAELLVCRVQRIGSDTASVASALQAQTAVTAAVLRRTVLAALGIALIGAVAFLGALDVRFVDDWAHDRTVAPSNEVIETLTELMRPGDVVLTIDPRSYFPMAYQTERHASPARLPGPMLCWDSGTEPVFFGTLLVPERAMVHASGDLRSQLVGLGPNGHVWLVALSNGPRDNLGFGPLDNGQLRQLNKIVIHPDAQAGQIRELVFPT